MPIPYGLPNTIEALALAKLFGKESSEALRDAVPAGVYEIDVAIHLKGRLKVYADHLARNHQRLNPLLLITLLLDDMPKQVRNARIRDAVARMAAGVTPDTSEVKAETEAAVKDLMDATGEPRKGKAIYNGSVSIVDVEALAPL